MLHTEEKGIILFISSSLLELPPHRKIPHIYKLIQYNMVYHLPADCTVFRTVICGCMWNIRSHRKVKESMKGMASS